MARQFKIERSRAAKKPRICGKCGKPIEPPEGYWYANPGYHGRTVFRHLAHPFRPSELTTSKVSEALAAQEAFDDAMDGRNATDEGVLTDLASAMEELTDAIRQYADERRESAEAWENGNSQLEELADTAEAAADELEGWEAEEWSGSQEELEWSEAEHPEPEEPTDEPDVDDYEGEDDPDYGIARDEFQARHIAWENAHDDWEAAQSAHEEAEREHESFCEDQLNSAMELVSGLEF